MPHRPGLILAAALLLGAAQAPLEKVFVAPEDESVLEASPVRVIAKPPGAAQMLLDGQPVAVSSPAAGVLSATLPVSAGQHELELAGRRLRFFVGAGAPAGWKRYVPHPPAAGCETCHAVSGGMWVLKRASLVAICFDCHDKKAFPARHTHNVDVLADCQICHNPHGSTAAFHLLMPKESACKQCHN